MTETAVMQGVKRELQEEAAEVDANIGKEVNALQAESEVQPSVLFFALFSYLLSISFQTMCTIVKRTDMHCGRFALMNKKPWIRPLRGSTLHNGNYDSHHSFGFFWD